MACIICRMKKVVLKLISRSQIRVSKEVVANVLRTRQVCYDHSVINVNHLSIRIIIIQVKKKGIKGKLLSFPF